MHRWEEEVKEECCISYLPIVVPAVHHHTNLSCKDSDQDGAPLRAGLS